MYVFNIRSVKMDIDVEPTIDYEVAIWDKKEIEVAPF